MLLLLCKNCVYNTDCMRTKGMDKVLRIPEQVWNANRIGLTTYMVTNFLDQGDKRFIDVHYCFLISTNKH